MTSLLPSRLGPLAASLALAALVASFAVLPSAEAADTIAAQPAPGACVSIATPCLAVPVVFTRTNTTPVRAYSVTLALSANLSLCGVQASSDGYLLAGAVPPPTFVLTSLGGNRWTIDEVTIGLPCGAVGTAALFDLRVSSAAPSGTGTITVESVKARDCSNATVAAAPGAAASITISQVAPDAIADLAAQQIKNGSGTPRATTPITLTFTAPAAAASVQVWRHAFGGYPQYDEQGGTVPTAPGTPLAAAAAGWTLTGVTTSGQRDEPPSRDFWYYVAFDADACGNRSAVSNRTAGTLDYHLGDVHNGVSNCAGDDVVDTADLSYMGANYGSALPVDDARECLDVGPTTDQSVDARPTTDNLIDFEDLILFAVNYGAVSPPLSRAAPLAASGDRLELSVPALPAIGESFAVALAFQGSGAVQGLSAQLAFDPSAVAFLGVDRGALLDAQRGLGLVLSSRAGDVDVVTLGGAGIRGSGELALARFRVKRVGDAGIRLERAIARDRQNRAVDLAAATAISPERRSAGTGLSFAMPTPFRDATRLEFTLAHAGHVELGIYAIDGRRVRQLVSDDRAAGAHSESWNGRGDDGRPMAAGLYYARLVTAEGRYTRTVVRIP